MVLSLMGLPGTGMNLSGGLGLAGLLTVLFPYFERLLAYLFNIRISDYFGHLFGHNSILGTTFGIVGAGALVAALQQLWNSAWTLYSSYFATSLEVSGHDPVYAQMLDWINSKVLQPRHVSLQSDYRQASKGRWDTAHEFVPSVGVHRFRYQGKKMTLERRRQESQMDAFTGQKPQESLVLSTQGTTTAIFRHILATVKEYQRAKRQARTYLYTVSHGVWMPTNVNGRCKRPLDSIILNAGVVEAITEELQEFFDTAEWYTKYGVPYRRGYLFYGPPGTGKTSFITALAGHFDLSICTLNLSDAQMTDEQLLRLMYSAPENAVILLEDVDAAFGDRAASVEEEKKIPAAAKIRSAGRMLTFSGLLNAVDGVGSAEGRIIFMTTNYIERLDSALIRPGRIDRRQLFDFASEYQVEMMLRRFYPACTAEEVQQFVRAVFEHPDGRRVTMAQLQGVFLVHKRRPADVIAGVSMLHDWIHQEEKIRQETGGKRATGRQPISIGIPPGNAASILGTGLIGADLDQMFSVLRSRGLVDADY
ncbi:mitochondrial chaperone BCS1-like [Paramacrobiotus metropolitanus]|uniref:mitochondrial chaperone BCS1-like n=1 Tax=Paramacrobiotus metropolitanus TaxID=2943436 RepID=UPI002445F32F|nr:mitochondrial chaperone BCS1-like [Paramacrobiotus metropolitanus]